MAKYLNKNNPFLIEYDDESIPANVDYCYGAPWTSLDEAWDFLAGGEELTTGLKPGFTIGVMESGKVVEYQLKKAMPSGGYAKTDFEVKNSGGGGTIKTILVAEQPNKETVLPSSDGTVTIPLAGQNNAGVVRMTTYNNPNDKVAGDSCINPETGQLFPLFPYASNSTAGVVKTAIAYNSNVNTTITILNVPGVALKECYKVPTWVSSANQVEALIPSATVNRPGLITETWFKRFYETYQKVQSGNDFDSSKTYAEGDIVKYDNALWEFNQAHTGAWDASHATKLEGLTNIVEEAKAAVDAKLLEFERELYYVIYGTYPSD